MLLAALVGPYFVDWTAYRSEIEAEATRLVGVRVRITGGAEVRLLPTPAITLEGVRLGDEDAPFASADRIAAEFDLPTMIRGEISVLALTVERPVLTLALDPAGGLDRAPALTAAGVDPRKVGLENVRILDGAVVLSRPGAEPRRIDALDLSLGAPALTGPYTVDGTGRIGGFATTLRLTTGLADESGAVRVISRLEPQGLGTVVATDGFARLVDGVPTYEGSISARLAGTEGSAVDASAPAAPAPGSAAEGTTDRATPGSDTQISAAPASGVGGEGGHLEGHLHLDPKAAELSEIAVTTGANERPLGLTGTATLTFEPGLAFAADLSLRQLDLDRLLAESASNAAPAVLFDRLVDRLAALTPSPLPGQIRLDVPALVAGGEVLQGLLVDAETAGDGWRIRTLSMAGPGRSTFSLSGTVATGGDPRFDGSIALAAEQPSQLVAWWRGAEVASPPAPPITVDGTVEASRGGVVMRRIRVGSGDSAVSGEFGFRPADGAAGAGLELTLAGPEVDLDSLLALAGLFGAATPGDLARSFAGDVTLDLTGERVRIAGYGGGRFRLAAALSGGTLKIDDLEADAFAGATIRAKGLIEDVASSPSGNLSASIVAPTLDGAAALAADLLPQSGIGEYLLAAGSTLSPAEARLALATRATDGGIDATLSFSGKAASTTTAGTLRFTGDLAEWRRAAVELEASLDNAEAGELFAQSGIPVLPMPVGAARAEVRLEGSAEEGLASTIETEIGGSRLTASGTLRAPQGAPLSATGVARLASPDLAPIALASGRVFQLDAAAMPVDLEAAFESLGSGLAVKRLSGRFAGATVAGNGALDFSGTRPRLTGEVALDHAEATALLELGLGVGAFAPNGRESGVWPGQSFAPPPLGGIDIAAEITADSLGVGPLAVADARFSVQQSADLLRLDDLHGTIAGGTLDGSVSVRSTGGNAELKLRQAIRGADAGALGWRDAEGPIVAGTLDLSLDLTASGRSVAALVASASGSGALTLANAVVRHADPAAFTAATIAADGGANLDPASVFAVFAPAFDAGSLALGEVTGALTLGGGVLRLTGVTETAEDVALRGGATLTLPTATLASAWTLVGATTGDGIAGAPPAVDVTFGGPLDAPVRSIDVSALVAQLTVRESLREAERVRALEEQVKEEQRRAAEAARQRAEEARRRAEAEKARIAAERRAAETEAIRRQREERARPLPTPRPPAEPFAISP